MNYLSHFHLHRQEKTDNFFTTGLTLPDIIGFFRRAIRVSEKYLMELDCARLTPPALSSMAGMIIHYRIDRWFHRSDFFKESTDFLQAEFTRITGHTITHFHVHILLEILIDRYLLSLDPDLAHDFYDSWRSCDWEATLPLFDHHPKFRSGDYLRAVTSFGHSRFLGEYMDFRKVRMFLDRLSERVEFAGLEPLPDAVFVDYFEQVFDALVPGMRDCIAQARSLGLSREGIMAEMPCKIEV